MSYERTNNVSVGDPTKKDHYDQLLDNVEAIRTLGIEYHLGGDENVRINDTTAVDVAHANIVEIDGANLTASHLEAYFEATLEGSNSSNQISAELYNITDTATVGSSQVNLTSSTRDRVRSSALTLPSSAKEYKARCFTANAATEVIVVGAKIVIK